MKRLFLFLIFAASASSAQTLDDARLAHNATSCESLSLAVNCTDAQMETAWVAAGYSAGTRPVDRQVFSTVASYRDSVILPPIIKARVAARRASFADKVANIVNTDNAKCVTIATALGADTAVCK